MYKPWSISKIGRANQCPRRFYIQDILKKKGTPVGDARGRIGSAVHKALEKVVHGTPADEALKTASKKMPRDETEDVLGFRNAVESFKERFLRFNAERVWTELRFGIDENRQPIDFWSPKGLFRGITDLAARTDGQFIVIDHKTGRSSLEKCRDQLYGCALGAKAMWPDTRSIRAGVHILKEPSDILWDAPYTDFEVLWEHMLGLIAEAEINAERARQNPELAITGWWCTFFNHTKGCPKCQEKT